eukprot:1152897-Pelagomonas_calceolata.AAC.6
MKKGLICSPGGAPKSGPDSQILPGRTFRKPCLCALIPGGYPGRRLDRWVRCMMRWFPVLKQPNTTS